MERNPTILKPCSKHFSPEFPDLLAGGQIDSTSPRQWLLIEREMGIPAEEDASIVGRWIIFSLTRMPFPPWSKSNGQRHCIRREVVGQMLDYAANAVVYWPVEKIRAEFEKNCDNPEATVGRLSG